METTSLHGIGQKLIVINKQKYLETYVDLENEWVYANWIGTPTTQQVKDGLDIILKAMQENKIGKILNDNRELKGTWTGALEWIVNDWTPRAIKAGYSAVAFIYSKDVFGKFSVDSLLKQTDENGPVKQKPFRDMEEAKIWLKMW